MICFFFVEETFNHVLGNKIEHVSPMFISEHELMQIWDTKVNVCISCSFITQIGFFVIPEIFFNYKCNSFKVKLNYKPHKIDFVVTLGPNGKHLNFVCKFSSRSVLKFEYLLIV